MSIDVMSFVWKNSKQKGAGLLLMLAIADNATDEGDCFPGIARLAQKVRSDERNVKRMIGKLEESGELLVFKEAGIQTDHGWTNLYRIVMNDVQSKAPPKTGRYANERGGKIITPRRVGVVKTPPQGVVETSPDPSVDPSVKDQKKKEVVVAPDPIFHPVFLEVTNDPTLRPIVAELTTPASRVPDDADFLIELFTDYFGDRFVPTRKQVLAAIVQYTFVEVRQGIEEARSTNKSGVVQWGYVEAILERRYQQKLDDQTTSTPHDRLLGLRFGYQPQSPADDMIHQHALWQAYRSKWRECTGEDIPVPPLKVKQYADTARFLDSFRVTPDEIGRLVEKKWQARKTGYSFLYTPEHIGELRAEDALRNRERDPELIAAVGKVWKSAPGDYVNEIADLLTALDHPMSAGDVTRFGAWYAAQPQFKSQTKPPSSADSLIRRVNEFRAQQQNGDLISSNPAWRPLVQSPAIPSLTADERAALVEQGRERRKQVMREVVAERTESQ